MDRRRVTVVGALGRLGREIARSVLEADDLELAGAVIPPDRPQLGHDVGLVLTGTACGLGFASTIDGDGLTIVDASSAPNLGRVLRAAQENRSAVVVATTGHDATAREQMRTFGERIALLYAPNLSLGITLLDGLVEQVATALPEADCEIVEAHHRSKADAPSGTARLLFETVRQVRGQASLSCGRSGRTGPRVSTEVGVHSLRLGDVMGEHRVVFAWGSERLELVHRAHNRSVFASGALEAIRFLSDKPAGYYTLDDLASARFVRR